MIVAGIGCRRGCPADDIVALVRLALGIPLTFVAAPALAAVQPLCPTRSHAAARHTGAASVAEGSALAAHGGRLLLARIGNGRVTCALAQA